jgi:hypothetical protein
MIIKLDDTRRIRGTTMCWQLEELRDSKLGQKWKPYAYYSTLSQGLLAAAQSEIRTYPAHGIAEGIEACNRVIQKYAQILGDVGKSIEGAQ